MAIAYFLKLDGIDGEAQNDKHKGEIDLMSFSWGAANQHRTVGSGMSAGKVAFHEFTVSKVVDKSSAKLLTACCSGQHIKTGLLSCAKSIGDTAGTGDYLTIKFKEIHVSSFQTGGSQGDAVGSESVSFAFAEMEYDYKIQKEDGTLTAAGTIGWNQLTNKKTA